MKIEVGEPERCDEWVVKVKGFSGDADADHEVEIYAGQNLAAARRIYLEASALARVFPWGRGGYDASYSHHLLAAGARSTRGAPFAWAVGVWHVDVTLDGGEATIASAFMERYDKSGRKMPVLIDLETAERDLLKRVMAFDKDQLGVAAAGLMAELEAWELAESTPAGESAAPGRKLSL